MKRPNLAVVLGLATTLTIGGLCVPDAAAQLSVRLRFEIDSTRLLDEWGPQGAAVPVDAARAVVDRLRERLPHWEFQPGSPPPGGGPEIVVTITEVVSPALSFAVELRRPGLVTPLRIREEWLDRGALMVRGLPPPETAANEIVMGFTSRVLDTHEVQLHNWLSEHVPVGTGAHWVSGSAPPKLILALPWDRYEVLRESVFRLVCEWPGRGTAIVESIGPGIPASYAPPPPAAPPVPPFEGVVVIAREREFAGVRDQADQVGPELFDLRPRFVYLKEYRPAAEWNTGGQP